MDKPNLEKDKKLIAKNLIIFFLVVVIIVGIFYLYFLAYFGIGYRNDSTVRIKGGLGCQLQTSGALNLIREKAPQEYEFINKYIGVIHCVSGGSGMYAAENPPRFQVGAKTREAGTLWYASTIIHDACHSKQYQDRLINPLKGSQADIKRLSEAECLEFQADAAQKMGADQYYVDFIKNSISKEYWHGENNY